MIRAVFFDAGHTLLHTHPSVGEIYAAEAAALGATADAARLGAEFLRVFARNAARLAESSVGLHASDAQDYDMWRRVVREVHECLPELSRIDADAWFQRLYEEFGRADRWKPYADVKPALEAVRARGLKLGIISNWSTRLRAILRETGLQAWFDVVVVSSEVGSRKPDPRIFQRALALAGVASSEAIHVGDLMEDDVRGAQAAGLRPILIWRRPEAPEPGNGVAIIRTLGDLIRRL
ncbi:MAG: HAD-IA family hydrolase [Planctomycetes bacterium]|nr:HAD-IA family hydrolase [Planctomycetota bacterium]